MNPGESFDYSFGVGYAINDRFTLSTVFVGNFQAVTEVDGVGLPLSRQEPMSLRFALTSTWNPRHIVEPFLIVGLTDDAPEATIGFNITRRF